MRARFSIAVLLLAAIRLSATTLVGSLPQACDQLAAVVLADGRVLVAGGGSSAGRLNTAEIYDPATRTFQPTHMPMNSRHTPAVGILLRDGRALILGGEGAATAEIYDPTTDLFTATAPPSSPHLYATPVMLNDGRVLIAGGTDPNQNPTTLVEIFDPATNSWSPAGNLALARFNHASVLLPDGRLLVAGGVNQSGDPDSEIFDPATQTSVVMPGTMFTQPIGVRLEDGRVVIVETNTISVFDEAAKSFSIVRYSVPTSGQAVTLLHDGLILLAGGLDSQTGAPAAQLFTVSPLDWSLTLADTLQVARNGAVSVVLNDGSVLVAGGDARSQFLASAEVFAPPARRRAARP